MTNDVQQDSPDSRFAVWIGATIGLFVAALAVGFVVLPAAQDNPEGLSLWGVICRAVGIGRGGGQASLPPAGAQPASSVAWTVATRRLLNEGDIGRGAAQATTCNNCHGANGISTDAAIPNLAGQSVAAIYKQLLDFKSGRRDTAVMGVYVVPLTDTEMLDLAAYYVSLPNPFVRSIKAPSAEYPAARHLIEFGDPTRSVPSCAACHGPQGQTPGAPSLRGQQRAYLEQQLQNFNAGNRHNDISEQMRTVARQLTQEEIAMLAAYYVSFASATDGYQ
jgi:cytochrome c553